LCRHDLSVRHRTPSRQELIRSASQSLQTRMKVEPKPWRYYESDMRTTFSELIQNTDPQVEQIPDGWKQGRTAYGGLTAALMLVRAQAMLDTPLPLRSALVNFTGPVSEPPIIETAILRQGRNVTTLGARGDIDGKAVCTATFSFGAARDSHLNVDCAAPDAPDPDDCPAFLDVDSPFIPTFTRNFETRLIEGNRPMSGGTSKRLRCWARHGDEASREGEAALLCLADILPPAALTIMKQIGPVSSMTWICNILRDPGTDEGWYQVEADLTAAVDGYSSQVMRIWNRRGDLIVEGMQSIAIFA
ncbi:MAG: thioesterase family protein, partial [Pseudomonadota bacterium]